MNEVHAHLPFSISAYESVLLSDSIILVPYII